MLDFSRAALAAKAEPVPAGTYDLRLAERRGADLGQRPHLPRPSPARSPTGRTADRKVADGLMLASVDERRLAGLIRRGLQITAQLLDAHRRDRRGARGRRQPTCCSSAACSSAAPSGSRPASPSTPATAPGARSSSRCSRARSTSPCRSSASARDPRPRGLGAGHQAPPPRAGGRAGHRGLPGGREPLGALPPRPPGPGRRWPA